VRGIAGCIAAGLMLAGIAGSAPAADTSSAALPRGTARHALLIEGSMSQGGLVFGTVPPGARIRANGVAVPVASSGAFAIPLARDAGPSLAVDITYPDGTTEARAFAIAKRAWPVQRIDGLPEREVTPSDDDVAAIKDEQTKIATARARVRDADSFLKGFAWPAVGPISGVFGSSRILNGKPRAAHLGLDIAAPAGSAVRAPADGIVGLVAPGLFFNGNVVILDHGLGVTTIYAHLATISVSEGQSVHRGEVIGTVGKTGRATGPHLHFGVNVRGVGVDPAQVLGPMPTANNTPGAVNSSN
jgi:murein DD-endopeptidase MepM/ murein hydrolase activator NlpD